MISKEQLQAELDAAMKQREQLVNAVHACNGAIQVLQALIREVDGQIEETNSNGNQRTA